MLRREAPRVVILGGGFAGLAAAHALPADGDDVRITLIDRSNHHLFQPLLYQVATAALAANDIASPIRKLFRNKKNTTVLMADVVGIDVEKKHVLLRDGAPVPYDYLIVATGMTHTYFGHDEWADYALGLKTAGEALEIRARILRAFEMAERETDREKRRQWTTFVVIGAGPTGVELAGAIAEIAGRTLARDFRHFDPTTTRVVLIEGGKRVLSTFHEKLSEHALRQLKKLGIDVRLQTMVTSVEDGVVRVKGEAIHAKTILWAAGVKACPLTKDLDAELDRAGRVKVNDDLSVPKHPEIFVLGDLISKEQDGAPLPGVAQLALQSGRHTAKNIMRASRNKTRVPFVYVDKGSMATIGRAKAIAEMGRLRFTGFFAWLLWLFIHVLFLVEFRNRIAVLFEWAYAYLSFQRSSRVILEAPRMRLPGPLSPHDVTSEIRPTPNAAPSHVIASEPETTRDAPAELAPELPAGVAPRPAIAR